MCSLKWKKLMSCYQFFQSTGPLCQGQYRERTPNLNILIIIVSKQYWSQWALSVKFVNILTDYFVNASLFTKCGKYIKTAARCKCSWYCAVSAVLSAFVFLAVQNSLSLRTLQLDIQTLPTQRTQKLTLWLGLNLATTWHHLH